MLTYPVPHVVVFGGQIAICGVRTHRHTHELRGSGEILAVELRPGALATLPGKSNVALMNDTEPLAAALVNRVVPLAEFTGVDTTAQIRRAMAAATTPEEKVATLSDHLARRRSDDAPPLWIRDMLEAVLVPARDYQVVPTASRNNVSVRSLQRHFRVNLGIGPKAALQRCRILGAAAALVNAPETCAQLAVRFGYFDQSHFSNDFRRSVGISPAAFAAGCLRAAGPASNSDGPHPLRGQLPGPYPETG